MTTRGIYREYLQELQQIYSANEAAVITDWVFESMASLPRSYIIKNPESVLHPETITKLQLSLTALLQHKPVQYVLNEAWFYKMKLKVNENVLIPRPETEELVQLIVENYKAWDETILLAENQNGQLINPMQILDIGTGSGCIAIALKKNLAGITMHAVDISAGALLVAKENAIYQQVDIVFSQFDFLNETYWPGLQVFDAIVSNPPYIPLNEKEKLDKNVTAFEPHAALFVPDNQPLLFYEKIADFGKEHLSKNGRIFVEIHEDFAVSAKQVFSQYYKVEIKKDFFGKERMLVADRL